MPDNRTDHVTREVLQRLVDEAAGKAAKEGGRQGAIEVLNLVTTHDMSTKEGQEAFRADNTWSNKQRVRCENVSEKAWWVGGSIVVLGVLGASWEHIVTVAKSFRP